MAKSSHNNDYRERNSWKKTRENVLERDGRECKFCGVSNEQHKAEYDRELSAHHIIPKSDGGSDTEDNLVTVCSSCHKTIEEIHGKAVHQILDDIIVQNPSDKEEATWSRIEKLCGVISDYLEKHPTIKHEHEIYPEKDIIHLGKHESMDKDLDINSERELFMAIGYFQGLERMACGLDTMIKYEALDSLESD